MKRPDKMIQPSAESTGGALRGRHDIPRKAFESVTTGTASSGSRHDISIWHCKIGCCQTASNRPWRRRRPPRTTVIARWEWHDDQAGFDEDDDDVAARRRVKPW
jgi:hypothetical protein